MTDHPQGKPDDWDDELDGTWSPPAYEGEDEDIELIVNYLNKRLDPEGMEAVRRRLEEDAEFHELAEPLILMWSVPKHLERHPRPEGELERGWAEFKRRSGFGGTQAERDAEVKAGLATPEHADAESTSEPKARSRAPGEVVVEARVIPPRRRWGRGRQWLSLFVLMIVGYMVLAMNTKPVAQERQYSLVPYDTGWIALNDGIEVQLTRGASLSVDHRQLNGSKHVRLVGTARFKVWPVDSTSPVLYTDELIIDTRAGSVRAGESEFTVTARADTTVVHVFPLGARRALAPHQMTVSAGLLLDGVYQMLPIPDNEGARMVRGRETQRIFTHR